MNTLTPKIASKFHPVFSVPEYLNLVEKYQFKGFGGRVRIIKRPGSKEEYWDRLPEVVLSKCPICGAEHTDRLDLHTLMMGGTTADSFYWGYQRNPLYQSCGHQVAMTAFINLDGNQPEGVLSIESEVPFLSTFLFPETIEESYAVINAFPICRIEGNQFVPRYVLFILKYYGLDPKILKDLRDLPWADESRPPFLYRADEAWEHRKDKVFDLEYWVEQSRLFWVDEEGGKTILKNNAEEFPYTGIEGYVEKMIFRNGEMQVVGHKNRPRYHSILPVED